MTELGDPVFEIINVGVVIVAARHNASLLHHSFLQQQGVVSGDEDAVHQLSVTTPARSRVIYESGLEFSVDATRFQVSDGLPTQERVESGLVAELALRYVRALPHVHYVAVGSNFSGLAMMDGDAAQALMFDRFLRDTSRHLLPEEAIDAEVKLAYDRAPGSVSFTVAPGLATVRGEGEPRDGVVVQGNYHHTLDEGRALDDAAGELGAFGARARDFMAVSKRLLGLNHD